jgi:hypothetical protein
MVPPKIWPLNPFGEVLTMKRVVSALLVVCAAMSVSLAAQKGPREVPRVIPLAERAQGAERVVVAAVVGTTSEFAVSDFGDQLIVSHAQVKVEESLKGTGPDTFVLDVEGGTVGALSLRVSDMPSINTGERAVFFVSRNASGHNVPHLRGQGVIKLDSSNMVRGTTVSLADVKRQIQPGLGK